MRILVTLAYFFVVLGAFGVSPPTHKRKTQGPPKNNTGSGNVPGTPARDGHTGETNPPPSEATTPMGNGSPGSHSTASGVTSAPSRDCSERPPIETYMQISSAYNPHADDKEGIYLLSDLREVRQVFQQKGPGLWPEQLTFFPDGVAYYRVSSDGQRLLLATHLGGDEQYDLYLLERNQQNRLTPLIVDRNKRIESAEWSPRGDWFAFTSNARNKVDFDLYRFWTQSKRTELLAELSGSHEVSDISPDGRFIAITEYRSHTDSDLLLFDLQKGKMSPLLKHEETNAYTHGRFTSDSKAIFFLSDRDSGYTQIHLKRIEEKLPPKLITQGKVEVDTFELNHKRNAIVYTLNEDGYSRFGGFQIDSRGNKIRNAVVPEFNHSVIESFAFSRNAGSGLWFTETSSIAPRDIWQWKTAQRTRWTHSPQGLIHSECFTREELVHYPTFDGRQIPAFLYRPAVSAAAPSYVVQVHGGPEGQSRPMFDRILQYLSQRGFGVLSVNVRGSTGYGRDYSMLDNYKNRMDGIRDTIQGAKWLLQKKYAQPGKLAITGRSYGGFAVLRSIQVEPDLFAVASEAVGISDFVTFLKNTKPYRRALREAEYGPLSDETFLKSISPMTYLSQIKTPLQIFHGSNDPRVPISESEQISRELQKRSVPVEFISFSDEGHSNGKLKNQLEQARKMVAFFEKYLSPQK